MPWSEVLRRAAALIRAEYVYPEKAESVATALVELIPAMSVKVTPSCLCDAVNETLTELTNDSHLQLYHRVPDLPPRIPHRPVAAADWISSDIGYVRIDRFPSLLGRQANTAIDEIATAFMRVRSAEALIIDVCNNHGGDGTSVAFATSYLFDRSPRLLAYYHLRGESTPRESWTLPILPHESCERAFRPLARVPIAVMVNSTTFSAAEEFAYNLQSMRRATVVGEVTRGGAHPTHIRALPAGFSIGIPFAETINPATRCNWEGVGVAPDIVCSEQEALERAIDTVRLPRT